MTITERIDKLEEIIERLESVIGMCCAITMDPEDAEELILEIKEELNKLKEL